MSTVKKGIDMCTDKLQVIIRRHVIFDESITQNQKSQDKSALETTEDKNRRKK